jgi:hypothetical protein
MDGDMVDFGNEPALLDPVDLGGSPVVMPNNDDWAKTFSDLGGKVISSVRDIVVARNAGLAAPSGTLASNVKNPPPGTGGLNMQASATVGGRVQPFLAQVRAGNVGAVLLLAAAAVLAYVLFKK